jgi:hypothetical protein
MEEMRELPKGQKELHQPGHTGFGGNSNALPQVQNKSYPGRGSPKESEEKITSVHDYATVQE